MLQNQDEDQLKQILSSTFTNNNYIDQQIQSLLITSEEPLAKLAQSSESQRSSEKSQSSFIKDIFSNNLNTQHFQLGDLPQEEKIVEKAVLFVPRSIHIFDEYYNTINKSLRPESLEEVRHKYPLFLLSQPSYEITKNIKELSFSYSGGLLKKNVLVMDAGYCQQQKVFKIAVGTDQGTVVIFEPNSSKPQKVIACFSKVCMITCVKWSKNMQYLAISNDEKQMYVYSFKQAIYIQNQVSYRILKTPSQLCYLGEKQLKNIVIQLYFVQEIPFQMLIVTEKDQIFKLQMKRHIINFRPQLTPLSCKVNNFLDLALTRITTKGGAEGVIIAVSGHQFVTVCLIQPFFEVIMVYDKQRHGSHYKKNGFPQVSFRQHPSSMMVVWDKYLEILDIKIDSYEPFQYSFSITHKEFLPDSTIIAGFLSNSLIYQVTRVGIKIHSVSKFLNQISKKYESKEVLFHKLNFSSFCYGERLQQSMSSSNMQIQDLRFLKGLFCSAKRTLFLSTNKGIQMIYFTTVQQYVSDLIQNNNWKTALEILKNCFLGNIYNLDEMQEQIITQKIREYSIRYINFLETVILSNIQPSQSNQNNILLLWNQQLIFIFNILFLTNLQTFFIEEVLPKIYKINPDYLANIIPFILTNRITKINFLVLDLLMQTLPKQCISKLLFNLLPSHNDNDLPHQINNLLIRHEMYLELVDLNQKFKDHYTSIAVLVGVYLKLQQDYQLNIMQLTENKRKIGKLLAYAVHDSLYSINLNKYSKNQSKQTLQSFLPLFLQQILEILVKEEPVGLFQYIIQELYMGNCLQTLNQIDVVEGETQLMKKIVNSIPYQQVVQFKCQKRYWVAVLRLYARRIIDMEIFVGLRYLSIQDYVQVQYLDRFVNKCYQLIMEQFGKIEQSKLQLYFIQIVYTKHISIIKLVGRMLGRYTEILSAMFSDENYRNVKVYEFLDQCLPLVEGQSLQQIKLLLKHNIKLLTYIDANRASDIICKYYLSDLNLFIDDLQGYNSQQMKLIHSVLQLYNYKQSLYSLKIKYLQLLAKNPESHNTILLQLTKENYPLDESLEICRKNQVLQAYAYLLVKCGGSGNTEAAIKVYFKIIWKKIYSQAVNHGYQQKEYFQNIIMYYLKISIQICTQLDLISYQSQWFVIMQELQVLKKNIFKNFYFDSHICQMLRQVINKEAYPYLVKTLIAEISYENVILYLRSKMGYFDLQALQILVDQIAKNSIYQIGMYHIFGDSFAQTESSLRKDLYIQELQGFSTKDVCNICEEKGGLLVHYSCGHQIHPGCGQDVRECIICKDVVEVIYCKKIDSSIKVKIDIYSGGLPQNLNEVEYKIEKETKLKKMSFFDQLNQFNSIEYDI